MNRLKILAPALGILAVSLMGLVASASAATVTSSTGATPTFEATSEGATAFDGTVEVTCNHVEFAGQVTSHGSGVTVKGHLSKLAFTGCGDDAYIVRKAGTIELHALSGGRATLTSSGTELTVEADTIFGDVHCVYTTNNTHIGTITPGVNSTMHIDSAAIPRTGGSFLCGSSAEWTGFFKFNHPTIFSVDA